MFKRKLNKKIFNSILITSLLVILLVSTFTASAKTIKTSYLGELDSRPAAVGANGLVTSIDLLASQAGLQILMKGGNAIDAAVATATTLHVVDYCMSGIDGNGFTTIYWAPENKVYNLSMTGAVPYGVDPEKHTPDELAWGYKAGCVPGAFGGWIQALQRFGTISLKEVLESAINYAENGQPVTPVIVKWLEYSKEVLELYPTSARVFLPNGRFPEIGEMFYMKDLAKTFKKLVAAEQDALAQGKIQK